MNQTGENFVSCSFDKPPPDGKVCVTGMENFGNCTAENFYGYNSHSPCVFLKLNRVSKCLIDVNVVDEGYQIIWG